MESNYLYGKKYVALGDSLTDGDFGSYVDENGLENRKSPNVYDAELKMCKTYPWHIGKRNNMEVLNMALCGGTMTYMPEIGPNGNERSLSTLYKKVPLDADYVTIFIGANDSFRKAPLGGVNDQDVSTFCGAWNVVLRHLITNMPYAKIGIIIPSFCASPAYPDCVRRMARKWGIPYLDLEEDFSVPLTRAVKYRPELCDEARELRNRAFAVSDKNGHPNLKAHEGLSTIVENFMRSL
ncbi:MAG: SGNH/GDSL hydrolase family protein [Clostridia bacterium]|nr:SGNH/GDSL hydrolase family protein [Clostridia bacterium]